MRPVYFASKIMTQVEEKYNDAEKMMFALVFSVQKFRPYLLSRPFVVLTMEHSFPFVVQHMHLSPRISKWTLELQEFEYTFTVEDSTRASLANILTYQHLEKKVSPKEIHLEEEEPPLNLENSYTLFFDGAYKRKTGIA